MIYERHCIGILAHKSRVAAARHTRLTRSTGPTSVQVQTQMRATHFARVLSHLAHRAQLANADTRICTSRHSSTALHLDFAGKHLEAHARQTPFAGWQTKQSRWQSPLLSLLLQHCSTHGFHPAPALRLGGSELVAATPPARKLHAAAQLLPRGHSACRSGLARKFGTAATLWSSRRVSSKLRPREEVLDSIGGRSSRREGEDLPPSCCFSKDNCLIGLQGSLMVFSGVRPS